MSRIKRQEARVKSQESRAKSQEARGAVKNRSILNKKNAIGTGFRPLCLLKLKTMSLG